MAEWNRSYIHTVSSLSCAMSFSFSVLASERKRNRRKNSDVIQGQVMFVRLGSSLLRFEFVSYVEAMLVQCIKCEGFFRRPCTFSYSLFLSPSVSLDLYDYLASNRYCTFESLFQKKRVKVYSYETEWRENMADSCSHTSSLCFTIPRQWR